ncbi:hypothetical protein [Pediococcus pentosaceus]
MGKKKHKKEKSSENLKIAKITLATASMIPLSELIKLIGKLLNK